MENLKVESLGLYFQISCHSNIILHKTKKKRSKKTEKERRETNKTMD